MSIASQSPSTSLCANRAGHRRLHNAMAPTLGGLLTTPVQHRREVRTDRDKISTLHEVDRAPIIVLEARINLAGRVDRTGAFQFAREDLFAEKLRPTLTEASIARR